VGHEAPGRKDSDTPEHLCITALPLLDYTHAKSSDPERIKRNEARNARDRARRAEIAKQKPKVFDPVSEGWYDSATICKAMGIGNTTLIAIAVKIGQPKDHCIMKRKHWFYSPEMFEKIRAEGPPPGSRSTYSLFDGVTWRGIHTIVRMLARIKISPVWSLDGINYYYPDVVQKFTDAYPESIYGNAGSPR